MNKPSQLPLPFQRNGGMFFFLVAILFFGVQIWAVIVFLQYAGKALVDPYPLDYGEGAVLDQAIHLFHGENIYRVGFPNPPYVINVYPPLYMLLQVPFLSIWGPAFWYGRIISILSALVTALLIVLVTRQFTRNWFVAISGGLIFLAVPYVVHWAPLFRVDMLALLLSWAGLFVVVRWSNTRWGLVVVAILLTASVYTRQSYLLAGPLTAFCWIWAQTGLKRAFSFALFLAGLLLGLFLFFNVLTKGGFFFNTITVLGKQTVSQGIISYYVEDIVVHLPIFLLAGAVLMGLSFTKAVPNYFKAFFAPYLIAAVISAFTIGKPGSNVNYLLELAAALSVSAVILIDWLRRWPRLYITCLILLTGQIFGLAYWTTTTYFPSHFVESHPENPQIMQLIHESDGPVLTDEYIGLLLLDQRPVYIQPFDFSVLSENGTWNQQPFLNMLDEQFFELIIIYNPHNGLVKQRWTTKMLQQIRQNYELVEQIENNEIYRRRP